VLLVALIQPKLLNIQPWDALKGTSVYFTYTGSKQALVNHLVITNVSTGEIVYSFEYSSFERIHPLPPNQLVNGNVYKAKLRVKFEDGIYSPYSQEVEFRTFATPILDIDNIDGQGYVYNRDVTFIALYSQSDNEKVRTYRFKLYDENEDLIQNYPVRYPIEESELTEVIEGLEKGKGYFIECAIETVNGIIYNHRERFIPMYIVPSANGVINTRNDKEEGFIRITANLNQVLGTQVRGNPRKKVDAYVSGVDNDNDNYDSDNYEYIDDEWVVVPKDKPIIFNGLGMNRASDFVMKLWCKDIPFNTKFMEISPAENNGIGIQFWRYEDRVVAIKEFNGIASRHCSNIVTVPDGAEYMIFAKVIEHRLDLSVQIL
jgi:hypothetical protein